MQKTSLLALALFFALSAFQVQAQDKLRNKKDGGYEFTIVARHDALPVQDQNRSGTCWSFSALSYFESELIRLGKGEHKLSEMFVVRKAYEDKATNYVRMHGNFNFGAGGAFHDIPYVMERYGIVPAEVYEGLEYGTKGHNHGELDAVMKGAVDPLLKRRKLTPAWPNAVDGILDAYLGETPEEFEYKGKKYTPESFRDMLGLDMDNYVSLTSYTHEPFYSEFILKIPDNWALGTSYNLPIDELIEVMNAALKNGHTFAWGADVSEKGFSFRDGLAIMPKDASTIRVKGSDNKHFSDAGAEKISNAFHLPVPQLEITQKMRQEAYDNYETTDDHGMHVTGLVKDQNGDMYYIVKNSWGDDSNDCDGYFYASEAYVRYKTMNIMIHKDAIPKEIRKKLGL